jgi:hypothetical protein
LRAKTPYQSFWIYLFVKGLDHADFHIGNGPANDPSLLRLNIKGDRMMEEIASAPDIVLVEDARTDPRNDKEIVARLGNRTIINVSIIFNAQSLVALGTGTFDDEGVRMPDSANQ